MEPATAALCGAALGDLEPVLEHLKAPAPRLAREALSPAVGSGSHVEDAWVGMPSQIDLLYRGVDEKWFASVDRPSGRFGAPLAPIVPGAQL